jgi:two-component system, NtrC family, sensor kinase
MSNPSSMGPSELAYEAKFSREAGMSAAVLGVGMLCSIWGDWKTFAILVAILVPSTLFNGWLFPKVVIPRYGTNVGETLRAFGNVLTVIGYGHVMQWTLPVWLWLPYFAAGSDSYRSRRALGNMVILVAPVVVAALLDGDSLMHPVCFTVITAICYRINESRLSFIQHLRSEMQTAELHRAQLELEAAKHAALGQEKLASLGMLAAGVAHEINNPMSFVTSNIRSLALDLKSMTRSPELLAEYETDVIPATLQGVERVNAIVSDLRRFSRGDPLSMVSYDLNDEMRAAARVAASQFTHGCRLEMKLGDVPMMTGQPRQIGQMMVNLLVNAAQAVGRSGTVVVETVTRSTDAVVTVRDTGSGMDAETLKKLFQPFFTTKPVGQGTGLGLAVTYGIVKTHRGTISVESAPGKGTCFTIVLPLVPAASMSVSPPLPEQLPAVVAVGGSPRA